MTRDEIKIKQCLLYLSLLLVEKKDDEQIFEKQMTPFLTNPEAVFIPICKTFYDQYPKSEITGLQLIPLFLYSMRLWGDFDHIFRNLWGANGQIAYVQPILDDDFKITEPKKSVKVKTVKVASAKKFWNFKEDVNANLLRGVVYDSDTGLQITNQEVFNSHIDKLYNDILGTAPVAADETVVKIKKIICHLMVETHNTLSDEEKNQLSVFSVENMKTSSPNSISFGNRLTPAPLASADRASFRIFYGPPGTGKTREARLSVGDSKERYKIVQVHPSSSYEDMIEGIKPVTFANGDVKYEVQDGPIKIMSKKANGTWVKSIASARHFKDSENEFILLNFPIGTISKWFSSGETYSCRIQGNGEYQTILNDQPANSDTIKFDIKNASDKLIWINFGFDLNHDSEIQERFVQLEFKGKNWGSGHYVIVLDELNRGNVASIMGELVFAISEARGTHSDKKAVTLQYSHEEFIWPQNLSLYGTMNSTDVSLDRIDQAIKRRFDFIITPPEPEVLKIDGLEEKGLHLYLKEINDVLKESAAEYGAFNIKDKLLGHAIFLPLKEYIMSNQKANNFELNVGLEFKKLWDNQIIQSLLSIFNGSRDELENFISAKLTKFSPTPDSKNKNHGSIFGWKYEISTQHLGESKKPNVINS